MPYKDPRGDVWDALMMLIALLMLSVSPIIAAALIALQIRLGAW